MKIPIIYKHIPKAGGTFLYEKLSKHFRGVSLIVKDENYKQDNFEKEFFNKYGKCGIENSIVYDKNVIKTINDIQLIRAHQHFFDYKKSKDYYLISCIRNPIDQFYSMFYHHKRVTPNIKNNWSQHTIDEKIDNTTDFLYDYTKHTIENCDFVGVNEYMNETLDFLNKKFNISMVNNIKLNNNTDFDKSKKYNYRRDELEKKLEKELDLYNEYCEKFKKKCIANS